MSTDEPRWLVERRARIERARGPFDELCAVGMVNVDHRAPVLDRVRRALGALREWRRANNQDERYDEEAALAVRTVAESMASEIHAAAGGGQDPATIAWVVAGLRCPRRPFCPGCAACFTIDAPHRADVQFPAPEGGASR